ALLTGASRKAMHNNLTGFEFANGIPGTLGGAVTMNAGAYGGEMKDVVSSVRAIDVNNNIVEYTNEEMNFRYRSSKVQDDNLIVLGVWIQLKEGNPEEIKEKMRELAFKRTSKQPLEMPSAGSTFKRPEGYFAAKLIEDAGLKGLIHKGAQVSEKHSGFVINKDNATCKDILELIEIIKQTVKEKFNVELEREVKIVGEEK
ncbi:MAG TPA: UDP-N-acetylmuramate dehydrogenase, partial [Tissierellaceae bacterium]